MQARAADIKDVAKRILNNLLGVVDGGIRSDVPVILAADDLAFGRLRHTEIEIPSLAENGSNVPRSKTV